MPAMGMDDALYYSEDRPDRPVRGGTWQGRDLQEVRVPIAAPQRTGPEWSWRYFHPGRVDARSGPADFCAMLHEIDPRLQVTWHPLYERWLVWCRDSTIRNPMHAGWMLLFPVQYAPSGSYMPLDARTLAKIWDRSPRKHGSGRQYWERIQAEVRRDYARQSQARTDEVQASARAQWDFAQIKVSMCGPSSGSKFTTHHSGN